ncbi:MAG: radical SAM protein [Bacteroidales bacterium]|nr:MAG: radical SAM protein [Bacteroidales bacterium]
MATFLFDSIVFGPIRSRRLGASLGINLLPVNSKVCSFDCIYCECGWTNKQQKGKLPIREEVRKYLDEKLMDMKAKGEELDVITYAGNGEPTLHPEFSEIIDDSIELRNRYFPKARIAVLSNATMLNKPKVVAALKKVDQNILKLDSAFDSTINLLNQPRVKFSAEELVKGLKSFEGNLIIQTMFLRGSFEGKTIDNTTDIEVNAWLELVKAIDPKEVMIYTIARDTPVIGLEKVSLKDLKGIATKVEALGIPIQVSA